jgi:hypothetical protein
VIADTTGNGIAASGVNIAPTLIDQSPTFGTIPNTQTGFPTGPLGTLVSDIVNTTGIGNFSDPDSGTQVGLVITATDTSHGTWWYTTNGGTNWTDVSAVSNTNALLLKADANSRLYFQLSSSSFSGTLNSAITFRAWDQTSGAAGTRVDASTNGGSTPFSSTTDTASLSANTSPAVSSLNGNSIGYTEGGSAVLIDAGGDATVTDSDSSDFNGGNMTVSIVSNRVSTEDVLSIVNQGTSAGQIGVAGSNVTYGGTIIGTFTGGSGTNDLVISFNGNATPAAAQALIRDVTYSNTNSAEPSTAARTIRFTVNDGDGGTSSDADVAVSVVGVNDAPTLSATGGTPTFTENGGGVNLFSGAAIGTVESGQTIRSLTLTVNNVADGSAEILNVDGSSVALTNGNSVTSATNGMNVSVGVAGGGTASITISKTAGIATTAAQTLIDALSYQNNSDNPSTANRVVTLTSIQDSGGTSNGGVDTTTTSIAATVTVTAVNDAPAAATSGGTTAFIEGNNVASTPVAIDSGITVSDLDNATFASAAVSITGNFPSGEDVLAFSNDGGTMGNIAASYDAATGVLTLTSSGAMATVAQWQAALRSVRYTNSSDAPNTATRTVSFVVNDGDASSGAGTQSVSVAAVDDAPIIGNHAGEVAS